MEQGNHKIAETFNELARLVTGRSVAVAKAKRNMFEPLLARFARKKA